MAQSGTAHVESVARMIWCATGLIVTFIIYGLLQERLMVVPWGEKQQIFTSSAFIVLSNRVISILGALMTMLKSKESFKSDAPLHKFALIALTNTCATYFQWDALRYVSFPTQTLGKCGKTIPVLILGTIFSGKKYGIADYIVCLCITIGCTIFVVTGVGI